MKNYLMTTAKVIAWLIPTVITLFSWRVSQEAKEFAKTAFVLGQKPYISVEPIKFNFHDSYLLIEETEKIDGLYGMSTSFQVKVTNTGHTIARNVRAGNVYHIATETIYAEPEIVLKSVSKASVLPNSSSLVPEESQVFTITMISNVVDRRAILDILEDVKHNEFMLKIGIEFFYSADKNIFEGETKVGLEAMIYPEKFYLDYKI